MVGTSGDHDGLLILSVFGKEVGSRECRLDVVEDTHTEVNWR